MFGCIVCCSRWQVAHDGPAASLQPCSELRAASFHVHASKSQGASTKGACCQPRHGVLIHFSASSRSLLLLLLLLLLLWLLRCDAAGP
jgi:hypothetical protein